jgi:hypothetical protein
MTAPIVTVGEDTDLTDVARLLARHHIKRVPVVKDGQVVGIVSRADLLRALNASGSDAAVARAAPPTTGFLFGMFGEYHRPAWEVIPPRDDGGDAASGSAARSLNAATFRSLEEDFHTGETQHHDAARRAAADRRQQLARQMIDTHVSDETWKGLLQHAHQAAAAGEKECLLLRFPNELCTDGGRAIDIAEEGWPATLRGEAAELYLRWERELKPRGFHLSARIVEYPGGMPGDVGLFLVWGT